MAVLWLQQTRAFRNGRYCYRGKQWFHYAAAQACLRNVSESRQRPRRLGFTRFGKLDFLCCPTLWVRAQKLLLCVVSRDNRSTKRRWNLPRHVSQISTSKCYTNSSKSNLQVQAMKLDAVSLEAILTYFSPTVLLTKCVRTSSLIFSTNWMLGTPEVLPVLVLQFLKLLCQITLTLLTNSDVFHYSGR